MYLLNYKKWKNIICNIYIKRVIVGKKKKRIIQHQTKFSILIGQYFNFLAPSLYSNCNVGLLNIKRSKAVTLVIINTNINKIIKQLVN